MDAEPAFAPPLAETKKSDLMVRVASAVVMLAIAGTAFWFGGLALDLFVAAIAFGVFVEYVMLASKIAATPAALVPMVLTGAVYIGWAGLALAVMPDEVLAVVLGLVICTDTGAYFTGRALGGPKIAPKISPSKTWSGLAGGMAAAGIWAGLALFASTYHSRTGQSLVLAFRSSNIASAALVGATLAIFAQAGDFYESWLKRRAGVKDSSRLIPGHGGLFDRVDGLLPVAIIAGTAWAASQVGA